VGVEMVTNRKQKNKKNDIGKSSLAYIRFIIEIVKRFLSGKQRDRCGRMSNPVVPSIFPTFGSFTM